MVELNKKIIQWAKERQIDIKGTCKGQALKTIEEIAELMIGIARNDIDLIEDALGDVYVTLVIGCMLQGIRIDKVIDFNENYDLKVIDEKESIWLLSENLMEFTSSSYDDSYVNSCVWIYIYLNRIAIYYNLGLKNCVEKAYQEISNRKGKMINGTFVKEGDY